MNTTLSKIGSASILAALVLSAAPFAFAEEGGENSGPKRPIEMIKSKILDIRQEDRREDRREDHMQMQQGIIGNIVDFRAEVKDDRIELNAEVRAALEAATTEEERQAILEKAREDRAMMRDDMKEGFATVRAENGEMRAEFRASIEARAHKHLDTIIKRLTKGIERIDQILGRIESRIQKLEDDGADVAAAVAAHAAAEASLADAQISVDAAAAVIAEAQASETPREYIEEIRAAVKAAHDAIKDAHQATREAIAELKLVIRADASLDGDNE